ncbi:D-glycero-beta-D-manno-heptose-7-phosphate kinase [Phaeovibrio sulfidiphilus]|uniref:Bifunctional protein HldE n=1 Tax=Phaeovibrio sulfidiphilus TaxID=1220600 RepID=A0A8J7CVX4_9PROT|nr:D-glycero-beta-D-manno-heptose-7-phosphate kinase [Phaeovibrio sulfidiphilus]MBE1236826.1 D-glycero-beta-D-manno-heptose-7-phosphate kinase [Phaeovibrio sulfidiphilus]
MTTKALTAIVSRFPEARVLCVGDVMLDRFVHGTVDRISPEAPIPVLKVGETRTMLGGAGNVVRNLVALGASVVFLSVMGDDAAGAEIQSLLTREKNVEPLIGVDRARRTPLKVRYVANGQQLLRTDEETVAPLSAERARILLETAVARLPSVDVLVLSDYGKGILADGVSTRLIDLARDAGVPVIVDPKGRDYGIYAHADLITPNRQELAEATGLAVSTDAAIVGACRTLMDSFGFGAVLATRSHEGMTLARDTGGVVHLPADAREVFDVSGAGDTVLATLAAALAVKAPLEDACRLANRAAGIAVGRVGTATVEADTLVGSLRHEEWSETESRVATPEEALERVSRWRRRGKRIGFTNGCFDLLHPGHVSLLKQAKAQCDRLVVGLNADVSVKRLKGEQRPVQSETARATVLASLSFVDLVVLFSEDTPLELIGLLTPDVLIKGADYSEDQVVGGDLVKAAGGRVFLASLEEGHSTTATLRRYHSRAESAIMGD